MRPSLVKLWGQVVLLYCCFFLYVFEWEGSLTRALAPSLIPFSTAAVPVSVISSSRPSPAQAFSHHFPMANVVSVQSVSTLLNLILFYAYAPILLKLGCCMILVTFSISQKTISWPFTDLIRIATRVVMHSFYKDSLVRALLILAWCCRQIFERIVRV